MGWSVAFQDQLWHDKGEQRRFSHDNAHMRHRHRKDRVSPDWPEQGRLHIVKKRFNRKQLLTYTVNLPACLIGIEAYAGTHFLARALVAQGHDVKLIASGVCSAGRQVQQE
jgi:transposase